LEECERNLAATLSILHFLYKRKFKLRKTKPVTIAEDQGTIEAGDGETFETTVQVEVLEGPDEVAVAPASIVDSVPIAISDEMTLEDLAREARSITDGDPMMQFTKFVSHGQGYVLLPLSHLVLLSIIVSSMTFALRLMSFAPLCPLCCACRAFFGVCLSSPLF